MNIELTILKKEIEDCREVRASVCTEHAVHAKTVTFA